MVTSGQRTAIPDGIHAAATAAGALRLPASRRFHRCWRDAEDSCYPDDRCLIVEVSAIAGRYVAAKQAVLRGIVANLGEACGIAPQNIGITIAETPRENGSIRGMPGDELALPYTVEV